MRFGKVVSVELRSNPLGGAVITVSDNGPGLEEGLDEKVLKPFCKADEARSPNSNSGFGLGLSIEDEVTEGHGGSLAMENILPHGLRVTIHLPAVQAISVQSSARFVAKGKAIA